MSKSDSCNFFPPVLYFPATADGLVSPKPYTNHLATYKYGLVKMTELSKAL